jgi:cytochrome b561
MKNNTYNPDLYQLHKSLGVLFYVLIAGRLVWRLKHPWQSSALGTSKEALVRYVHLALISLMILMPTTGFLVSSFSGFGIHLFGFFIVPEYFDAQGQISPPNDLIYNASKVLHNVFACSFVVIITLHVLAALKHHFIDKDDTLKRMLPSRR